jgi:glycosyltransferase involved in cell wall biosynthesis
VADLAPTVRIIRLAASHGVSAARNAGLEQATGAALLFLDDDDLLNPRMVETAMAALAAEPGVDVWVCLYDLMFTREAGSDAWLRAAPGRDTRLAGERPMRVIGSAQFAPRAVIESRPLSAFLRFLIPIHTCVVRRASIGPTRFPEELRQGEDTHFWLTLAAGGCRFRLCEEVLVSVRRHGGNTTRSRERYFEEISPLYRRVLREGLAHGRDDRFLVHLKLTYFAWRRREAEWVRHAGPVLAAPDLLAREAWLTFSKWRLARRGAGGR